MRTVRRSRVAATTATEAEEADTSSMGSATADQTTPEGEGRPRRRRRKGRSAGETRASRRARRKAEKAARKLAKTEPEEAPPSEAPGRSGPAHPGQLRSLVMATHPRTALAITVVVALLVALMGRDAREIGIAAAAALVVQLVLGIMNDLFDRKDDAASLAPRKPIAAGWLPPGNASFAIAVLLLLALPLALQNGPKAGSFLLATVPVGYIHNRWLHRTALSWVGWSATFALLTFFITLGGWGSQTEGTLPLAPFVLLSAALGFFVHFLTTLPDLVSDNRAQVRSLPLRIALRTGATKLLVVSALGTLVVVTLLVYSALTAGIAS